MIKSVWKNSYKDFILGEVKPGVYMYTFSVISIFLPRDITYLLVKSARGYEDRILPNGPRLSIDFLKQIISLKIGRHLEDKTPNTFESLAFSIFTC
jgi:hypothetical protein